MTCIMFNPAYCTHRFAFPVVPGVLGSIVVSHIRAPDNCLAQRVWYLLSDFQINAHFILKKCVPLNNSAVFFTYYLEIDVGF